MGLSELNKKDYRIALISGGADSAYHSVIATSLVRECKEKNYKVIWYQSMCTDAFTGRPYEVGEHNIYNLVNYDLVDAVVMLTTTFKSDSIQYKIMREATEAGVPVISVDRKIEGAYCIMMDYEDGLEELVRHVVEVHGSKTFGFLTGMKGQDLSDAREQTYRKVLAEYGIAVDESKIEQAWFWHEGAENVIQKWYDADGKLPEAIICANDSMAIGVANKALELGYSLPDELIITGLDGIEEAMNYSPSITTAKINIAGMVKRVVELIEPVCCGKVDMNGSEVIAAERIYAQSCGCQPVTGGICENEIKHKLYNDMDWFKNSNRSVINTAEEISANVDFETAINQMGLFLKKIWSKEAWLCVCDDFLTDIASISEISTYTDYRTEGYSEMLGYVMHMTNPYGGKDGDTERVEPFESKKLIPDMERFFEDYCALTVLPLHFQDRTIGYLAVEFEYCEGNYSVLNSFDCNVMGMVLENARIQHELRHFATRLDELYIRDPMTNLFNRRGFYRQVPKIYDSCVEEGKLFMIVSADLDELKEINDIYGHADGDNAITMIARALESAAKNGEIIARFGGDEYVVAGVCPTEDYGTDFIANVRKFIDDYNEISGKAYKLRTSCGVYTAVPDGSMCLDEFISTADKIMYDEKMLSKMHRGVSRRRM